MKQTIMYLIVGMLLCGLVTAGNTDIVSVDYDDGHNAGEIRTLKERFINEKVDIGSMTHYSLRCFTKTLIGEKVRIEHYDNANVEYYNIQDNIADSNIEIVKVEIEKSCKQNFKVKSNNKVLPVRKFRRNGEICMYRFSMPNNSLFTITN